MERDKSINDCFQILADLEAAITKRDGENAEDLQRVKEMRERLEAIQASDPKVLDDAQKAFRYKKFWYQDLKFGRLILSKESHPNILVVANLSQGANALMSDLMLTCKTQEFQISRDQVCLLANISRMSAKKYMDELVDAKILKRLESGGSHQASTFRWSSAYYQLGGHDEATENQDTKEMKKMVGSKKPPLTTAIKVGSQGRWVTVYTYNTDDNKD